MNLQDSILADRYAKALYQASVGAKAVEPVLEDLKALADVLKGGSALAVSLTHPRLTIKDKKAAALRSSARKAFHALTDRFIDLLLAKKRAALLPLVASLFQSQADASVGLARVQVRSARPLSLEQTKALTASLQKALGSKQVALESSVDESLLGGVVVRAGDKLWDLSLAGRLKRMKEKLLETSLN